MDFVDSRQFYREIYNSTMSIYAVPHDCCACQDTIWLPYPLEPLKNNTDQDGVVYRPIATFLGNRTVYFPVLKLPLVIFDWYLKTIYKDLFQVAKTFPYSKPFQHFAVGVREEILKTKPSFYCVHARINEAYFLKQREGFLNATREGLLNLTQQFTKEENATRPLLLILSDAPLVDVVKGLSPEIAGFEPITRLPRFSDLVEKTQKELPAGQDLMHFEAATCVLAKKFLGHSQSTFSRRIRALRQL